MAEDEVKKPFHRRIQQFLYTQTVGQLTAIEAGKLPVGCFPPA